MALSDTTLRDYESAVRRWKANGQPEPRAWVDSMSSPATRRNMRAALIWYHRTERGLALDIPHVPQVRRVPVAFTDEEVARVRDAALGVHPRCRPIVDLLYTTGARLGELCAVQLADLSPTHIVLRVTKRRAGGLRVERAIPLSDLSRGAARQLIELGPGRLNTLVATHRHTVQDWMRVLERRTGIRVHAHKFRTTFCTHLLQRGVPIHEVQRLMGHTDIATTMKYAAVTDERLIAAVALLG